LTRTTASSNPAQGTDVTRLHSSIVVLGRRASGPPCLFMLNI